MSQFMTANDFKEICHVPRETMDRFIIYSEMLLKWQRSINLVSNSTLEDMWRRHFYDSAQLINHINFNKKQPVILDIGSGAGFPGLVLSMFAAGDVHVVESNGKKCAFMKQVIQKTGINAIVHNERIETMNVFHVDLITSRACAELEKLFDLTKRFISPKTKCLFLKGEKAEEEIKNASKRWNFEVKKTKSMSEETGIIMEISQIQNV